MSESVKQRAPEPALAFLEGAELEPSLDSAELDALFAGVRDQIGKGSAHPLRRLAEQPTSRRKLFGLLCFALTLAGVGSLPAGYSPVALTIVLASFGALLVAAVLVAFRPIYLPALSPVWKAGLCVAAVAAAFTIALVPELHRHANEAAPEGSFLFHVLPCLSFGLLVGFPGYVFLRLLDRGAPFGPLLAGVAAGLTGNTALELHCAIGNTEHLVLGHAMVVALFITGVALLERLVVQGLTQRRAA